MNKTVTFTKDDVELLYSIPSIGGDIGVIIRKFVLIHRAAPPSFSLIQECILKAMKVGILLKEGESYHVEENWYQQIHAHVYPRGSEFAAMLDFEEKFVGKEIEVINVVECAVTKSEYDSVVSDLEA